MRIEDFLKSNDKKYLLSSTSYLSLKIIEDCAKKGSPSFNTYETDIKKFVKELTKDLIYESGQNYLNEEDATFTILSVLKNSNLKFYEKHQINYSLATEFFDKITEIKLSDGKFIPTNDRLYDLEFVMKEYDRLKTGLDYADSVKLAMSIDVDIKIGLINDTYLRPLEKKLLDKLGAFYLDREENIVNLDNVEIDRCYSKQDEVMNLIFKLKNIEDTKDIAIVYTDSSYKKLLNKFIFTNYPVELNKSIDIENAINFLNNFRDFYESSYMVKYFLRLMEDRNLTYHIEYDIDFTKGIKNYTSPSNKSLYQDKERIDLLLSLVENEEISFNIFKDTLVKFFSLYTDLDISVFNSAISKLDSDIILSISDILNILLNKLESYTEKTSSIEKINIYSIDEETIYDKKHTFFLGMSENYFSCRELESPVILNSELKNINKHILTSEEREQRKNIRRRNRVQTALQNDRFAHFSYPMFNEKNEEETCSYFLELMDKRENYINYLENLREYKDYTKRPILDLQGVLDNFIFSATSLEIFMNDPRQFYFKYILKIEDDYYDDSILNAIPSFEMGSIVHLALESFVIDFKRMNINDNINDKLNFFDRAFDNLYKKYLTPKFLLENFKEKYRKMLFKKLLTLKEKIIDCNDVRTEVGFGDRYSRVSLTDIPVNLDFGKYTLKFTGKIDRMDIYEDKVILTDYKTGSRSNIEKKDLNGELFQHHIYEKIVNKFIDKTIKFEYDILSDESIYEPLNNSNLDLKIEKMLEFVDKFGFIDGLKLINMPKEYKILERTKENIEKTKLYSGTFLVDEYE